ncbi:MAG: ABC transporter permease subunit, partial [Eubacteriales bacterium]|nr:ABC transporter permease subunit [Eubacteriales bacterium]
MKGKTCIRKSILQDKSLYLMILPGFLLVLIFSYLPLLGLRLAFFRFDYASGLWGGKFVGLRYFRSFFHDPYCGRLIRNTFLLSLYTLLFSFPIPIIYAMMANEISNRYFKKFCQSVSLMPYFISTVVIVGIMMKLFSGNGVINMLFRKVGLEEQIFFSDKRWFRPLYVISEIWTNTGYNSVIYIAVLASVNQQLYEAAMIDGANRWQKAIHITLPALMPTVRVLLIMALG